jgi:hypothetical protein
VPIRREAVLESSAWSPTHQSKVDDNLLVWFMRIHASRSVMVDANWTKSAVTKDVWQAWCERTNATRGEQTEMLCLLLFHYYDHDNTGFNHRHRPTATDAELAIRAEDDGAIYLGFNPMMAESSKMDALGLIDLLARTLVPEMHRVEFTRHVSAWCCDTPLACVRKHGDNYLRSILSWGFYRHTLRPVDDGVGLRPGLTSLASAEAGAAASAVVPATYGVDVIRDVNRQTISPYAYPPIEHTHYAALQVHLPADIIQSLRDLIKGYF